METKDNSNGSVPGDLSESLFVVHSLLLGEPSRHKPCFVLLDASICNMLDLVEPPETHHWLPLWSWHNVSYIILHDGGVLLHHGISPYLLVYCLLIIGRLGIYDVAHQCHVVWKILRRSTHPKYAPRSLNILLSIPQCPNEPSRSPDRTGRSQWLLLLTQRLLPWTRSCWWPRLNLWSFLLVVFCHSNRLMRLLGRKFLELYISSYDYLPLI